jgi:spore maturation protein CgeB
VAGEHVPNDELRRVYSSAKIVLADHWPDMREYGYISNRIYDALASGATVVSDAVTGIDERLGDAVAIYHSREQLHQTIDSLLADEDQRRRRAEQGRELVRRNHTFEQRLDVLLQQVNERRSTLGYSTSIVAQAEVP